MPNIVAPLCPTQSRWMNQSMGAKLPAPVVALAAFSRVPPPVSRRAVRPVAAGNLPRSGQRVRDASMASSRVGANRFPFGRVAGGRPLPSGRLDSVDFDTFAAPRSWLSAPCRPA